MSTAVVALTFLVPPVNAALNANVTVFDFGFNPGSVTVDFTVGMTNSVIYTYVPNGFSVHQVKSDPHNAFGEGACLNMAAPMVAGQTVVVPVTLSPTCLSTILTSGSVTANSVVIDYHCHIHPFMVGSVVVKLA